jgi:alkaline phosphatase D
MKCIAILVAVLLFTARSGEAQILQPYDLGGASKPKTMKKLSAKEGFYKRVHQTSLRLILRGEIEKPQKFLETYQADHPQDAETAYMLAICHGLSGNIDAATESMNKALALGLPPGRLVAGPREVLRPLAETELIQSLIKSHSNRLVHGPLVGNVSGSTASFWVRTATQTGVIITVSDAATGKVIATSQVVESDEKEDFTAVAKVAGLTPDTEYKYFVSLGGQDCVPENKQQFRTLPAKGEASKFVIAFGGGAGYVPPNERMWDTIGSFDPQAILLFGDNVYIDDPESVVMQQYTYHRRQSRPEWRKLTARSPVFTIWDDHDFGTDDSWGGADISLPFWKKDWVFPTFRQNWANPGYGGGDEQPGCWYTFHIGEVDFIMLDCRYYRTSPKEPPATRTMLGPVQKKWLKEQLTSIDGTFKVICSSVPWDFRTKGDSTDTWNGYRQEHEEILRFLETEKIEGVILMSADRHRSDAWKISRPEGYDLYEFNSSRLTNQHVHSTMEDQGAIFSYNEPQSFGLVTFDTTVKDPQVTYEVVNIDGENPHSITVKRSELRAKD